MNEVSLANDSWESATVPHAYRDCRSGSARATSAWYQRLIKSVRFSDKPRLHQIFPEPEGENTWRKCIFVVDFVSGRRNRKMIRSVEGLENAGGDAYRPALHRAAMWSCRTNWRIPLFWNKNRSKPIHCWTNERNEVDMKAASGKGSYADTRRAWSREEPLALAEAMRNIGGCDDFGYKRNDRPTVYWLLKSGNIAVVSTSSWQCRFTFNRKRTRTGDWLTTNAMPSSKQNKKRLAEIKRGVIDLLVNCWITSVLGRKTANWKIFGNPF